MAIVKVIGFYYTSDMMVNGLPKNIKLSSPPKIGKRYYLSYILMRGESVFSEYEQDAVSISYIDDIDDIIRVIGIPELNFYYIYK